MKTLYKLITTCLLLTAVVALPQSGSAEFSITSSPYINVSITNTASATVYVLFPDASGTWYLSETLPTKYYSSPVRRPLQWWASGDAYLFLEPNASTGMAADETDSLTAYIQPLVWDEYDQEFALATVDKTYLVFDTANTYTSTSADWLDWTTGLEYGCLLTGELWPTAGFAITLTQNNSSAGIGIYTLSLSISRQYR